MKLQVLLKLELALQLGRQVLEQLLQLALSLQPVEFELEQLVQQLELQPVQQLLLALL
jgi:hypothetical protein